MNTSIGLAKYIQKNSYSNEKIHWCHWIWKMQNYGAYFVKYFNINFIIN